MLLRDIGWCENNSLVTIRKNKDNLPVIVFTESVNADDDNNNNNNNNTISQCTTR